MGLVLLLACVLPTQGQEFPRVKDQDKERATDRVLEWNANTLDAIRRDRTAPPLAVRNLAIVHLAIYDAANVTYGQNYKPYLVDLKATTDIDSNVAISVAAHRVLISLYPKQKERLDTYLNSYLATVPRGTSKSYAIELGRYVAAKLLAARKSDLEERETSFRPSSAVGLWRQTDDKSALLPTWGQTKPFGVKKTSEFRPIAPPVLASEEYAEDFNEVKDLGGKYSRKRTAEQTIIAWFWEGGAGTCTPPGHWNQIARVAAQKANLTQDENARLFALLNLAMADASICCWESKYRYKLWRPVTAIREADRDSNNDTDRDAKWEPLLTTPPFPSYTSGHSTFSGAAAAILEQYFGEPFEFEVGSDSYKGMTREFRTFSEAAREAGKSRIYGGIHFECDNREGLKMGKDIAEEIFRTRLTKKDD